MFRYKPTFGDRVKTLEEKVGCLEALAGKTAVSLGASCAKFDKTEFDFSTALRMLKGGSKMRSLGWSSPNMLVYLRRPLLASEKPYFVMITKRGDHAVWFPAICDLLAEDWVEVSE